MDGESARIFTLFWSDNHNVLAKMSILSLKVILLLFLFLSVSLANKEDEAKAEQEQLRKQFKDGFAAPLWFPNLQNETDIQARLMSYDPDEDTDDAQGPVAFFLGVIDSIYNFFTSPTFIITTVVILSFIFVPLFISMCTGGIMDSIYGQYELYNVQNRAHKIKPIIERVSKEIERSPPGVIWVESDGTTSSEDETGLEVTRHGSSRRVQYHAEGSKEELYWYGQLVKLLDY